MQTKFDIIRSYTICDGIGIDICDEIMSYIIDCNSILPIQNTIKFIRDETDDEVCIKLYQGCNCLVKYNILLDEINFISNEKILFVNLKVLICSLIIVNIYTDRHNIYNSIIPLMNTNNILIDVKVDIDNIKLKYELSNIIKNIYIKISSKNSIFPDFIKTDIRKKLNNLENKKHILNNQKLLEKINILKNKFLL